MIQRAIEADVPFAWVAADSVYGVGAVEMDLRQAGKGYVLGVMSDHPFTSWLGEPEVSGTAVEIMQALPRPGSASPPVRVSRGRGCMTGRIWNWPISRPAKTTAGKAGCGPAAC